MAKKLTIKMECFSANKNKTGSTILFAKNIENTDKGPAAKTVVNLNVPDIKVAADFEPGKEYTITIEG